MNQLMDDAATLISTTERILQITMDEELDDEVGEEKSKKMTMMI